jgi:hypothetical protein
LLLACISVFPLFASAQKSSDFSIWYPVRKVWQSALFQGPAKQSNYFEGWYFKQVAADGQHIFSVIPGIAHNADGSDSHAFIQLIDGVSGATSYHTFPSDSFSFSRKSFEVSIGQNHFSREGIKVDFGEGEEHFRADLTFSNSTRLKSRLFSPGIMGWYRFAPFMETYHGLVSMDHQVEGQVETGGQIFNFSGGRGYIEKDWGSSFPSSYIWAQSNNFEQSGVSFMCSIARVPWLGKAFPGFLGFFLHEGKVYRFATYTGAKVENLVLKEEIVEFDIAAKKFRIEVRARRSHTGLLKAPVSGAMDRRIAESLDAVIHLKVTDRDGKLIFEGAGKYAGLEVVGKVAELQGK